MLSVLKSFCIWDLYPLLHNSRGNWSSFLTWVHFPTDPPVLSIELSECSLECFVWIFQIKPAQISMLAADFSAGSGVRLYLCGTWFAEPRTPLRILSLSGDQPQIARPQSLSDETGCHIVTVSLLPFWDFFMFTEQEWVHRSSPIMYKWFHSLPLSLRSKPRCCVTTKRTCWKEVD